MKNLLELRDEIDVIDKQIVALYQQRMQIAAEVAEYKIETGKKFLTKTVKWKSLRRLSALGDSAFNRHESGSCLSRSCRSAESASIS